MTLIANGFPEILQLGPHFVAVRMTPHLQYFRITVKVVALEKFCFSDRQYPKAFC